MSAFSLCEVMSACPSAPLAKNKENKRTGVNLRAILPEGSKYITDASFLHALSEATGVVPIEGVVQLPTPRQLRAEKFEEIRKRQAEREHPPNPTTLRLSELSEVDRSKILDTVSRLVAGAEGDPSKLDEDDLKTALGPTDFQSLQTASTTLAGMLSAYTEDEIKNGLKQIRRLQPDLETINLQEERTRSNLFTSIVMQELAPADFLYRSDSCTEAMQALECPMLLLTHKVATEDPAARTTLANVTNQNIREVVMEEALKLQAQMNFKVELETRFQVESVSKPTDDSDRVLVRGNVELGKDMFPHSNQTIRELVPIALGGRFDAGINKTSDADASVLDYVDALTRDALAKQMSLYTAHLEASNANVQYEFLSNVLKMEDPHTGKLAWKSLCDFIRLDTIASLAPNRPGQELSRRVANGILKLVDPQAPLKRDDDPSSDLVLGKIPNPNDVQAYREWYMELADAILVASECNIEEAGFSWFGSSIASRMSMVALLEARKAYAPPDAGDDVSVLRLEMHPLVVKELEALSMKARAGDANATFKLQRILYTGAGYTLDQIVKAKMEAQGAPTPVSAVFPFSNESNYRTPSMNISVPGARVAQQQARQGVVEPPNEAVEHNGIVYRVGRIAVNVVARYTGQWMNALWTQFIRMSMLEQFFTLPLAWVVLPTIPNMVANVFLGVISSVIRQVTTSASNWWFNNAGLAYMLLPVTSMLTSTSAAMWTAAVNATGATRGVYILISSVLEIVVRIWLYGISHPVTTIAVFTGLFVAIRHRGDVFLGWNWVPEWFQRRLGGNRPDPPPQLEFRGGGRGGGNNDDDDDDDDDDDRGGGGGGGQRLLLPPAEPPPPPPPQPPPPREPRPKRIPPPREPRPQRRAARSPGR